MVQLSVDGHFQRVDEMQNDRSPLIGFWRRKSRGSLAGQVEGIQIFYKRGKGLLMERLE